MREWNSFKGQLYTVGLQDDLPHQLPLPYGGFASYSPDGNKLAYNRIFREFRTWKRYRGGMADDIWICDFSTKELTNLTKHPVQDIIPMWSGDRIYFLSDRDESNRMNLYVYDTETTEISKLTDFTDFDIKFPSPGREAIVFENGGYIYRFDLESQQAEKIPVFFHEDHVLARDEWRDVSAQISNYEIAPDGNRALFGARGDVFTVPVKYGITAGRRTVERKSR